MSRLIRLNAANGAGPYDDGAMEVWERTIVRLDYAFQPIVQMRTGRCHGFEALLRGLDRTPYADPNALLDTAWIQGVLPNVESALQAKAVEAFTALKGWENAKLFLNIDARAVGTTTEAPATDRFPGLGINLEITERKELRADTPVETLVERYRRSRLGIVLDDFGVGYAGLKLLYEIKPDYVKVDRFFISGIERDVRRRAIAQYLVNAAHALGILTVAEGIETEVEFHTCRDLGFDFGQGYLLARPQTGLCELPESNDTVVALNRKDRRRVPSGHRDIHEVMERLPPLEVDSPKTVLLNYFSGVGAPAVAPVVDGHGRPLGMVRERDLKRFIYSRFGGELLRNKEVGGNLADLVAKAPVCDVVMPLDRVIEAFSAESASDGIIVIEDGEYAGFLSSGALIRLIHERNLAMAADQNPLSRLPGNAAVMRHIETVLVDTDREHILVHFDFDNFKPFNDTFGFRQGDRAILMFADRLRALAAVDGVFAGHIGGDDFFLALSGSDVPQAHARLSELVAQFRSDAEALYDPETRAAGFLVGKDRYGATRSYPLLSVTGVAVSVPPGTHGLTPDDVNAAFAANKTEGKRGSERLRFVDLK